MPKPITQNTLFYGDNLPILRKHVQDESKVKKEDGTQGKLGL